MDTFGRTERQAESYLCECDDHYDFEVVTLRDIAKAKYPDWDEDMQEYMFTGAAFYRRLLEFNGIMLHSSAVVVDGKAYLFSADSGVGKSTHTGLWLKLFGSRAYILNDDKPALRLENGVFYAYGTPWSGKNDVNVAERVPVAGIAFIERSTTNLIVPFKGKEAIAALYRQVNRPKAAECRIKVLEIMDEMVKRVPMWRLFCNTEADAAIVSYEAMSGTKLEGEALNET